MCSRSGRIPLMVTLGTHTPADGLRDTHGPATQSHGPTLRDLRTGGMRCVIDVLKGAGVARPGAEMFQPLTWRWHLSLVLGALERVHDITSRTADDCSSAYSTGVALEGRRLTLRRHDKRARRQQPPRRLGIAARRLSSLLATGQGPALTRSNPGRLIEKCESRARGDPIDDLSLRSPA